MSSPTQPTNAARHNALGLQIEAVLGACAHVSHGHSGVLIQALEAVCV